MEIALFASSFVLLIAYLVFSSITYRKSSGEPFDLRNHFPYELWIKRNNKNYTLNILIFIPFIIASVNFILFAVNFYDVPTLLSSIMVVASCFAGCALFVLPLNKLREHCMMVILFLTCVAISNGFLIYKEVRLFDLIKDYILLLPIIVNAICGLFAAVMMFHPYLFEFDMERDPEGKLTRPKRFTIAYTEWGLMIALILSQISIVVVRIVS